VYKLLYKNIIIFAIIGLILPSFSFAQIGTESVKEKMPSVPEGWWNATKMFWGKFGGILANAFKKAWQSAVWFWQKMWGWFQNVWNHYIWPKFEWLWEKILILFRRRKY
jgi:hypothetical protein